MLRTQLKLILFQSQRIHMYGTMREMTSLVDDEREAKE